MTKKFLVSVADVWGYDTQTQALLFIGKTLLDTSIETALNATDVRAGRGAPLQYVYYNSPDMTINISDAQWNLDYLAANIGSSVTTGANIYVEETVTLGPAGAGTVVGTPLAVTGATVYGWVTLEDGTVEKVEFTGSNFTSALGAENDVVCVRYYALDAASRQITVSSNIVPSIVRLVLEAQLASSDVTSNVIGKVTIEVPTATMTGNFTISLTPDGVASTPLSARALQSEDTTGGCAACSFLARITETVNGANWYDNLLGLAIGGGDFALTHPATKQLVVYAIPASGAAFIPPVADLTFSSSVVGDATVDANGLVTTVSTGSSLIHVTVTAATQYDASVTVTVN